MFWHRLEMDYEPNRSSPPRNRRLFAPPKIKEIKLRPSNVQTTLCATALREKFPTASVLAF